MKQRIRLPPFIEVVPVMLGRIAERIVDTLAEATYNLIKDMPALEKLTDREKKALAYAIVGDLMASPLPPPLDVPLDIVVQDRLRSLLPEMDKYRRMFVKIVESIPYLEILPSYTISVMATIREKEVI